VGYIEIMGKRIIHIITGDGKGKTTASLGLALRSLGAGKKVKIIQFMKKPIFSEHKAIKKYKLPIDIETFGIGFYKILGDTHTDAEHKKSCEKALSAAHKAILSGNYDLIILDEINVALSLKLLDEDQVIELITSTNKKQKKDLDIVLTGRNASKKIIELADLVSEIKNVKNYFDKGIQARKGIEF
jgi:cob(I)alamin adenosyltransferase